MIGEAGGLWHALGMDRITKTVLGTIGAGAAVGAACLAYGAGYEVRSFRLRRFDVPVLAPGSRPLRILHLSDLHITPRQRKKSTWVAGLAALEPDLVVNTGDNLSHPDALPILLESYGPLFDFPGVFVFGSNDYYAPRFRSPLRYLYDRRRPELRPTTSLPYQEVSKRLQEAGWLDLNNARGELTVDDRRLVFAGVDDPHIGWDDYSAVGGPPDPGADLPIGVAHAPYQRVLDAMAHDGYPLLLAGHTHGGQVCVPGYGALVTNCDLDGKRAKGVSRWRDSWLHVSAGLGTSPYAPYRFACPPEATLLTLRGSDQARPD